jgi:ABC-type polysaccharide/polyol phosphate transport system ATPase subunit
MAYINFKNVVLEYPIYNAKSMSLRNQLVNLTTGGVLANETSDVLTVRALDKVSFDLKDGDRVGLVGHNGAGKTTLLRTMAGIFHPISGEVKSEGRISSIIELGGGLDNELSGYENIIRMGMMLGGTKLEMETSLPDIEEFTDLGNFLSVPVRTYSAGMLMRLMFAVGTSIRPEILLVDEMFGAGDASFRDKAESRMKRLIGDAKIFVFASHSHELIEKYCHKIFVLEHGKVTERKI